MEQEVRRSGRKLREKIGDLQYSERRLKADVRYLQGWWKGSAAQAFIRSCEEQEQEISALYKDLDEMESELARLACEIRQADDERRRAEDENRRQAVLLLQKQNIPH